MEINILIEQQLEEGLYKSWFSAVIERVLTTQNIYEGVELGLLITGQQKIHQLNKAYRDVDKPTDVLAFPMASATITGREQEEDFCLKSWRRWLSTVFFTCWVTTIKMIKKK